MTIGQMSWLAALQFCPIRQVIATLSPHGVVARKRCRGFSFLPSIVTAASKSECRDVFSVELATARVTHGGVL